MDRIEYLLGQCLGELREWLGRRRQPRHGNDVFARIERQLRQLRRARDREERARLVLQLELLVRDQGPVADGFLPSLEALHAAIFETAP